MGHDLDMARVGRPAAERLAWGLCAFALLLDALGSWLLTANASRTGVDAVTIASFAASPVAPILGAFISSRRPGNPIGWIVLGFGLVIAMSNFGTQYAIMAFVVQPASLPGAVFVAWLIWWLTPTLAVYAFTPLFVLLFPDGRPPTRHWRPLIWIALSTALLIGLAIMLRPTELTTSGNLATQTFSIAPNPTASALLVPILNVVEPWLRGPIFAITTLACLVSLVVRFVRAGGDERHQLKWLAYVAGLLVVIVIGSFALTSFIHTQWPGYVAWFSIVFCLLLGFPAATAIAILKYHLYDIDIVINRSLVFGTLAIFIGAVYVGIVVGLGYLAGTGGRPSLLLSIVATAVVAIAFQPVRQGIEQLANRLVFGQRAAPYEVLQQFSQRVGSAYAAEDVLPRMAEVLAKGTGATGVTVFMRVARELVPAASWPDGSPAISGTSADRVATVHHQDEVLGEITIKKRAGEAVTLVEDKLLRAVASQAGLVLRNIALTTDLQARLGQISEQAAELRASRRRIVATQDQERRRLERNVHDGAQQHLVALMVRLRLADTLSQKHPERTRQLVSELRRQTAEALETLQDLARGIYPQVLSKQGLVPALTAEVAQMAIPVDVQAEGLRRYAPDAEAAVYFACLEALQNVAKHGHATAAHVKIAQQNDELIFSVADNGVGIEPSYLPGSGLGNMADRLAAFSGRLEVVGKPGGGTTVTGHLLVGAVESSS